MSLPDPDDIWPRLARAAGLDPDTYRMTRDWVRRDPKRKRVIRLYSAQNLPSVVFKQSHDGHTPQEFETLVNNQISAHKALGDGLNRVPQVLAYDADARAFLMEGAGGDTLFDQIQAGADHATCLARAGAWTQAWHSAHPGERRAFQPRHNRDQVIKLLTGIRQDDKKVPDAKLFCRTAEAILEELDAYAGQETITARLLGDLNFQNLVLDRETLYGIDITRYSVSPVGYDLARLLVHHASLATDEAEFEAGQLVPSSVTGPFFRAYSLVSEQDPSFQVISRVRFLNDWSRIPVKLLNRTLRQTTRLQRMKRMAKIAYGI